MKFFTVKSYPYSAKLYGFTVEVDGAGNPTRTYTYDRDVRWTGGIGTGNTMTIYLAEALNIFEQLQNLQAVDGNEIFPGVTYEVRSCQPLLNIFGSVEGYRHSIVRLT